MELGMQTESTPFAFRQLWTCIMISIKAESLRPTVMKETPVSEPPLQTTTTSSRRPPLAATAQVIKKIKSWEKKKERRKKNSQVTESLEAADVFRVNRTSNKLELANDSHYHWMAF